MVNHPNRSTRDILETMEAELDECVALLRPHYPEEKNEQLRNRATGMRQERYARGRWPSDNEIAEMKAAAEKATYFEACEIAPAA